MNLSDLDKTLGGDLIRFGHKLCGVYFLADENDEIIYVGQSRDIGARVAQHQREKTFAVVYYITLNLEDLTKVENWLIRVCLPRLNVVRSLSVSAPQIPGSIKELPTPAPPKPGETRQQRWRRLHPDKYRAGQAALMKRRRQKKAASSAPTSSE